MSITWKEGITTLAAIGAVVLDIAYYNNYTWPLVSSTRWIVLGMGIAAAIMYLFSYVLDADRRNAAWSVVANVGGLVILVTTILGLIYAASGYVATLMVFALVFWAAAIIRHLAEPRSTLTHHPAM